MQSIFIKKTLCKICTLWIIMVTLWTAWNGRDTAVSMDQHLHIQGNQNMVSQTISDDDTNTEVLYKPVQDVNSMPIDTKEIQNNNGDDEEISENIMSLEKSLHIVGFDQLNTCDKNTSETHLNCKPDQPIFKQHGTCQNVRDCVTVICKTRFRLDMVQRMITSLWNIYPEVRVIITDDTEDIVTESWHDFLEEHTELISYYQLGEQVGISRGRGVAASLVQTKYFFQIDDDLVLTKSSNLMKLVEILENSNIDLVAGHYGNCNMLGCMTVTWGDSNKKTLYHYYKAVYGKLDNYPHCYMLDIVQNVYLARTAEVIIANPWDSKFKMYEHTDFFLEVKQKRLKTAICLDVELTEVSVPVNTLRRSRTSQKSKYMPLTLWKWGLEAWYRHCDPEQYPIENEGNIIYKSKVMVNGTRDFKGQTQRFY